MNTTTQIHPTADISPRATIGSRTIIWHQTHIREDAHIGNDCILGKNCYIDRGVIIGNNVKIQNNSSVYAGTHIEDGVFIGPGVIFTNDKYPRSVTPNGSLKRTSDWQCGKIIIKKGASLGAGVIVLPDIVIGDYALIAAGSVVTKNVPPYALVRGNPGRVVGMVCSCAKPLGGKYRQSLADTKCTHT